MRCIEKRRLYWIVQIFLILKYKKSLSPIEDLEKDKLIAEIIDYLYRNEKKHYEEFPQNERPEDHIYLKLEKLKRLI